MTLQEAIKILQRTASDNIPIGETAFNDAIKLGIEALKGYVKGRTKPGGQFFHDLPGETEE